MLTDPPLSVLLASNDPSLLAAAEPVLLAAGARLEFTLSAEAALSAMRSPQPPSLVLLDALLPGMDTGQLLAAVRAEPDGHRLPVVLLSDLVTDELQSWLNSSVLDDLIPRSATATHWALRLQMAVRAHHRLRELEVLRESAAFQAQIDPLTGVFNRGTLLSLLFRETDRVQRMKTPLSLLLFDLDNFGHWNSRLGTEACDDLLCQVAGRVSRLLRSYDLLGRAGKDEYLLVLPGCAVSDALMLAERLRMEVFALPFQLPDHSLRLSACFGIAVSDGRSPVVVLREAELALQKAKVTGPESIQCFGDAMEPEAEPVAFLSGEAGKDLLAW
ncbi:MAG TPA: diguanylate cyclase [Terracidiphilus sp.]|nr:diguanylate cyclase [Terracidiphilus sp.]